MVNTGEEEDEKKEKKSNAPKDKCQDVKPNKNYKKISDENCYQLCKIEIRSRQNGEIKRNEMAKYKIGIMALQEKRSE